MKVKNLEREIERKFKSCLEEFTTLVTLYEAYCEIASEKRPEKFLDKMGKKYAKEVDELEERIDIL